MTEPAHPAAPPDEPDAPSRVSIVRAVRLAWAPILTLAVALAALGAVAGALKPASYQAQARLTVGNGRIPPGDANDYAIAVPLVAPAYTRAIRADEVVDAVAAQLRMTRDAVRQDTSAATVPNSALIVVNATAGSAQRAVALANATASSLRGYVNRLNAGTGDRQQLARRYDAAARVQADRAALADALQQRYAKEPSPALRARLVDAQAAASTAQVRAVALQEELAASVNADDRAISLTSLAPADGADSGRGGQVAALAGLGAGAGLLYGAAIATFLLQARARRRLATA